MEHIDFTFYFMWIDSLQVEIDSWITQVEYDWSFEVGLVNGYQEFIHIQTSTNELLLEKYTLRFYFEALTSVSMKPVYA